MKLHLHRLFGGQNSTIGKMVFAVGIFLGLVFTCEDEHRDVKVAGETRIPAGTYPIKLRAEGGFHERYLARFGADFHKGMLWLQGVPGFEWVLIHCGNTEKDTKGCIIVGMTATAYEGGGGEVSQSEAAYRLLYPAVRDAILRGVAVTITITDEVAAG